MRAQNAIQLRPTALVEKILRPVRDQWSPSQEALVHPPHCAGPLRELFTELIGVSEINRYLVEMVMGLDVRYPAGGDSGDGPVGGRLPHVPLGSAAGETSGAAVLRNGRGVFLDLSGEPADSSGGPHPAAAWADRGDVVVAEPVPQIRAAALLVRPDGHVAWSGKLTEDGAGPVEALRNWFSPATVATSPTSRRPE
ncbi:hypothetical protein AB0L00_45175 [Actinoallomurus sp. NPDC052308]|uniref:aromatic-ring hydroxylase C-terminal domain-containing protein n=1 Tax=Actinoallomurus sp. NPDC052308 TaxID=3155530 RepID=UPI0034282BC7